MAAANLGGEKENGALETVCSVVDGRVNEKAGLAVPNDNPDPVVTAELGVAIVPKAIGVVVVEDVVVDKLVVGKEAGAEMAAVTVEVENVKEGAVELVAAEDVGTPNFMLLNGVVPVECVEANENPVLVGAVVTAGVIVNPVVGVEATDVADGIPNFIWENEVAAGAETCVPGFGVSQAAHLITS